MINYLEYMPLAQNRAGQLGNLSGQAFAQWATGKNFTDCWGDPANWANTQQPEIYGVADIAGEQWITLTRLGPHRIKTVKAIVTRGATSQELTCEHGHPYALITFDAPYDVEIWGDVGGLPFYWRAWYTPTSYVNPFLGVARECIDQSEVWGNPADHRPDAPWQWTRGGPAFDARPFVAGQPVPIKVESAWFQGIGKGYGPGWVMGEIKAGAQVITSCANSNGWGW